ncbi:hypothetical protein ACFLTJ_03050 [Chloroflexota bacterium]
MKNDISFGTVSTARRISMSSVINIPPAQQITPTWIYAIIGIGCALAVVVIVLIVRTRRP